MNVILYVPNSDGDDIRQRIEGLIPEKGLKIYRTLEGLSERLHRPIDPETILIIVACSQEKLSEIFLFGVSWKMSVRSLLPQTRIRRPWRSLINCGPDF